MSTFPNEPARPQRPSEGLAITSMILSVIGLLLAPLALIGLILGIVSLARASKSPDRYGGKGYAIAGTCIGGAGLVVMCLSIGILLPALGKARQAARQMKSQMQMRMIGVALSTYATDNRNKLPEAGADWQQRLGPYLTGMPGVFTAPSAEPGEVSYFYIPGHDLAKDSPGEALVVENPDLSSNRGHGGGVLFLDGHVERLEGDQFFALVQKLKLPISPRGTASGRP